MKRLHLAMVNIERYAKKMGAEAFAFGSPPHHACLIYGHSWYGIGKYRGICKRPDLFRYSCEACGIDLYKLAKKFNIPTEIPPTDKVQCMSILLIS